MDLRSVLNNSDNGDRRREPDRERAPPSKAPPTPQQAQPPHHQQTPPQYYRSEYGHPGMPHRSPGKPSPQEYPPHHPQQHQPSQGAAYPSHPQSPYQAPGPYPNRPPPPPLQPVGSFHDVRSPAGMPAPSPTAYRASSTPSTASGPTVRGYPFPPSHGPSNEMTSPSMRQQTYPPAQYQQTQPPQPQRQDSYPHAPGPSPYSQPASIPQTPPVVTPGGSHSFIQQRSQSTQSTPTPTSAHSQHQYGPPHVHGSPVAAHQLPPSAEYNRQPSQPPTPRGPPLSAGHGQPGPQSSYPPLLQQQQQQQQSQPQPSSPYQQRVASTVGIPAGQTKSSPVQPQARSQEPPQQPVQHFPGPNNAPPQPHSLSESPATDYHRRALSQHEREHSLSVSPKTRVPSLPSNADRNSVSTPEKMVIDHERTMTPAKRKLDDRDLSPQELEHKESRPPPGELNGYSDSRKSSLLSKSSVPPKPQKKRIPRSEKPIWAQSIHTLGKKLPAHANFVLQERVHSHINGGKTADGPSKSRHPSPEAVKSQGPRPSQSGPAPAVPAPREVENPADLLGAWEPTITNVEPYPEMPRLLADFLFLNIINCPDIQEIRSRGIKFEIEAKLGTLIDKDTNHRVDRALASEALLESNNRTAFKSSMTEAHHKAFNDFLNKTVIDTDPRNPTTGGKRVQVLYKHRREIDSFIELPSELQAHVPGCMLSRLSRKSVRVRVTHDQKTGEVLGKIIKARVADIDIHFPACPMDCRVSVNLEMDWDGPSEELDQLAASQRDRQPNRNKDRLSYTHGHYQVDLTQVTQQINGPGGHTRTDKEHELEIELAPEILIDQGNRAMSGAPHRYQELVTGFIDNVRLMARKAREFP